LAATLENKTRDEIALERDVVKEKYNYARAQRDDVVKRIELLNPTAESGTTEDFERTIDKADRIIAAWRPQLVRRAVQLEVEPDYQIARETRQSVEGEIRTWQGRIQESGRLAKQIEEGQARADATQRQLKKVYDAAYGLVDSSLPAWSDALPRAGYVDLENALGQAFEAEGGETVRQQLNQVENKLGKCEGENRARSRALAEALNQSVTLLNQLGFPDTLGEDPSLEQLEDLSARLSQAKLEDRQMLQSQVNQLHQRVGALRDTVSRLDRELNLGGELVDADAAKDELEKVQHDQQERKYASEIAARARKRIVQKVLPSTMDYMRRILPQLTRDRYHDAELDPESYKIRVWDERAGTSGAWKEKNIFSGGTRDQFSLALRLAFALATLPQERGTTPGFIFLDEPLGSFDDERTGALLYLLTEGEIGRAFDQIFLISHVRVPENRFTHRIRLDHGTVVENSMNGQ
jgi:exonuclease SbcC